MPPDDIGEICVANPGVNPGSIYTQEDKNRHLFHYDTYSAHRRSGEDGRPTAISGSPAARKDLIIRSGHNIDPAVIEDALLKHPAVAMSGAIGQPDAYAGEIPCAYVELVKGQSVTGEELAEFAARHIAERAAVPKHVEVLDEIAEDRRRQRSSNPTSGAGRSTRVLDGAFAEAGLPARVESVIEDKKRGLVARIAPQRHGIGAARTVPRHLHPRVGARLSLPSERLGCAQFRPFSFPSVVDDGRGIDMVVGYVCARNCRRPRWRHRSLVFPDSGS